MKRFRTIIFWTHLTAGVSAGIVIFIMSATGALLAFQPQILGFIDRDIRRVAAPPASGRLGAQAILEAAAAAKPGAQPVSLTLDADPRATAQVAFGAAGNLYVDPYTGAALGEGSTRARAFFRTMTDWHRYLAVSGEGRRTARAITGAGNLVFLGLGVSGLFLWWPRQWTRSRLRAVLLFDKGARGKARDFNWHNVIGFWCAPVIIVMTLTATVISYPWATDLVHRLAGSPPPVRAGATAAANAGARGGEAPGARGAGLQGPREGQGQREAAPEVRLPNNLDLIHARASALLPTWGSIVLRLPPRAGGPVSLTLTDATHWNRFARSQLTLDGTTADVVRWEPYAETSRGAKLRGWMRFAHTGELGGVVAQAIAGLACAGGAFLVWTGLSLALRRYTPWRRESPRATARAA
jgi:uncharacterized iron-regulated membrane protein